MTILSPEYLVLQAEVANIQKLKERVQKTMDRHNAKIKQLLESCTHEEIEVKSSYFPGSYNDKAYTDYWNRCKLCGATSEKTTDEHSYYG
jgi:hypothetical protein